MVLSQQYGTPKKKTPSFSLCSNCFFFFGGGNLVSRETGFPSHWISAPPTGISGWMWRALMPKHLGELFRCVFHRWFDEQHHKSQPPAGYSRRQVLWFMFLDHGCFMTLWLSVVHFSCGGRAGTNFAILVSNLNCLTRSFSDQFTCHHDHFRMILS